MTKNEVVEMMTSCTNNKEWGEACDRVKEAHGGGYPDYWYSEMIMSGLIDRVLGEGSSKLRIIVGKAALDLLDNEHNSEI